MLCIATIHYGAAKIRLWDTTYTRFKVKFKLLLFCFNEILHCITLKLSVPYKSSQSSVDLNVVLKVDVLLLEERLMLHSARGNMNKSVCNRAE